MTKSEQTALIIEAANSGNFIPDYRDFMMLSDIAKSLAIIADALTEKGVTND